MQSSWSERGASALEYTLLLLVILVTVPAISMLAQSVSDALLLEEKPQYAASTVPPDGLLPPAPKQGGVDMVPIFGGGHEMIAGYDGIDPSAGESVSPAQHGGSETTSTHEEDAPAADDLEPESSPGFSQTFDDFLP